MSTTPRTDAAKEQYLTGKMGIYGVLNEARQLETELAAAKEAHASQQRVAIQAMSELAAAKAESAEWKKLLFMSRDDRETDLETELARLRAYGPKVDDLKLQALFDKGTKAWSDVPSAGAWVDELRGGSHG